MSAVESRRSAFKSLAFGAFGATAIASPAFALDMDAFVNSELDKDTKAEKKEMTADEALCRFGQSGATKKVEACKLAATYQPRDKASRWVAPTPCSCTRT